MTREQIAHLIENVAAAALAPHGEVIRFTPSIKMGRRYVGIKIGEKVYQVTLDVEDC